MEDILIYAIFLFSILTCIGCGISTKTIFRTIKVLFSLFVILTVTLVSFNVGNSFVTDNLKLNRSGVGASGNDTNDVFVLFLYYFGGTIAANGLGAFTGMLGFSISAIIFFLFNRRMW